ncbi:MAG: hypothetical protein HYV07_06960 [Deltaproteobacteria bacterium]|nr:hypothetical protein [Deltaproteobacteria bacterium]
MGEEPVDSASTVDVRRGDFAKGDVGFERCGEPGLRFVAIDQGTLPYVPHEFRELVHDGEEIVAQAP